MFLTCSKSPITLEVGSNQASSAGIKKGWSRLVRAGMWSFQARLCLHFKERTLVSAEVV